MIYIVYFYISTISHHVLPLFLIYSNSMFLKRYYHITAFRICQ